MQSYRHILSTRDNVIIDEHESDVAGVVGSIGANVVPIRALLPLSSVRI